VARAWSMRWWLGTFAVAVTLPPLALLTWTLLAQIQRERADARNTALRIARANAESLAIVHRHALRLLDAMAQRPAIRDFDGSRCDALFGTADFLPEAPQLMLIDARGRLACSSRSAESASSAASTTEALVLSKIRLARSSDGATSLASLGSRWVYVASRPLRHADGRLLGHLAVVERPEIAAIAALPRGAVVTVLDAKGIILARSLEPERWVGRDARSTRVVALALREREGRAEGLGVDGVSRQYGFATEDGTGWHVYVGVPTSVAMEPVRIAITRSVLGSLAVIALVVVVASVFARRIVRPINAVAHAAVAMTGETYTTIENPAGPEEMVRLATAFNEMVVHRVETEWLKHESERRLKALSDRLITIQENERTRIARELHDDLGQALTALKMDIVGLLQQCETTPLQTRILSTLDATVTAVQRISSELRPSVLDDLGVVAAIESEAHLFEARTGIECELSLPETLDLPAGTATVLYRVFQEALTNVSRHANATRVEVRLRTREGEILLEIRDDGRGVTASEIDAPSSLGLIGIRERVDLVGGTVRFQGIPGRGTIVSVRLPWEIPA
jgi:signal transduction histidine kinase